MGGNRGRLPWFLRGVDGRFFRGGACRGAERTWLNFQLVSKNITLGKSGKNGRVLWLKIPPINRHFRGYPESVHNVGVDSDGDSPTATKSPECHNAPCKFNNILCYLLSLYMLIFSSI